MKNWISSLSLVLVLVAVTPAFAGWHNDYTGTLGDKKIGLTITKERPSSGKKKIGEGIIASHYYYQDFLKDIPLRLKSLDGRDMIFEEYDDNNNLRGVFNLSFEKQDPKHRFQDENDLREEVLVGTWRDANGKNEFPVYLSMDQGVSGDADGGRCGLSGERYKEVQEKIRRFHVAVVNKDSATLQNEFNYKAPTSEKWLKAFSHTIPHDMFCNYQGFMLGSGIVWFDHDGNVIAGN